MPASERVRGRVHQLLRLGGRPGRRRRSRPRRRSSPRSTRRSRGRRCRRRGARGRADGMPCTTSSFTEMQITAGNVRPPTRSPGTPASRPRLRVSSSASSSSSAVRHARLHPRRAPRAGSRPRYALAARMRSISSRRLEQDHGRLARMRPKTSSCSRSRATWRSSPVRDSSPRPARPRARADRGGSRSIGPVVLALVELPAAAIAACRVLGRLRLRVVHASRHRGTRAARQPLDAAPPAAPRRRRRRRASAPSLREQPRRAPRACGTVRGKPSRMKPRAQSAASQALLDEADHDLVRARARPAPCTASPRAPSGVPSCCAARSMSPVEICGMPTPVAARLRLRPLAGAGRSQHHARARRAPSPPAADAPALHEAFVAARDEVRLDLLRPCRARRRRRSAAPCRRSRTGHAEAAR